MHTFLNSPAVLALASLLLAAFAAALTFVALIAAALRHSRPSAPAPPMVIYQKLPQQRSPLRYAPLPQASQPPQKQPPKKRQAAKPKAIIRPMRFDHAPSQKFHFK